MTINISAAKLHVFAATAKMPHVLPLPRMLRFAKLWPARFGTSLAVRGRVASVPAVATRLKDELKLFPVGLDARMSRPAVPQNGIREFSK